jgi:hypothetical protein
MYFPYIIDNSHVIWLVFRLSHLINYGYIRIQAVWVITRSVSVKHFCILGEEGGTFFRNFGNKSPFYWVSQSKDLTTHH